MDVVRGLGRGLLAGTAGTVALNATTYLDMLVRGRPPSQVPTEVARKLAEKAGFEPASGDEEDGAQSRHQALGGLLGLINGVGVGALYGLVRVALRDVPVAAAAAGLGAAAMAGSNIPATALGVTHPTEWGVEGWVGDVVPHLVYGLTVALLYEASARV